MRIEQEDISIRVLFIAGPSRVFDRVDDVAADFDASRHSPEEIDCLRFYRDKLGDRLASLGDGDRLPPLRHLVHQAQTVGLEVGSGNVSILVHSFCLEVIAT